MRYDRWGRWGRLGHRGLADQGGDPSKLPGEGVVGYLAFVHWIEDHLHICEVGEGTMRSPLLDGRGCGDDVGSEDDPDHKIVYVLVLSGVADITIVVKVGLVVQGIRPSKYVDVFTGA